jgi:hypothetical protein
MGAKAKSLLTTCSNFEFFFLVQVLDNVLKQTLELSESIQDCELDILVDQQNIINQTLNNLFELRSDVKYSAVFDSACQNSSELGIKTPQFKNEYKTSSE